MESILQRNFLVSWNTESNEEITGNVIILVVDVEWKRTFSCYFLQQRTTNYYGYSIDRIISHFINQQVS